MSQADLWIAIVALSCTTLFTRASMLFLPASMRMSPRLERALRYAGPCILMAIVVPDLLRHDGAIDLGPDNIRLFAALTGVAVLFLTRSPTLTIVCGLTTLTLLRLFT